MHTSEEEQQHTNHTNVNTISEMVDEKRKNEEQQRNERLKEKIEFRRKQQIQFVMTQTNYDEIEATHKLEKYNHDVMKVVSEYLGIGLKKDENLKKTKNQKVFSVIRDIMDSGSRNFIMQQEKTKKIEDLKKQIEIKKKQNEENIVNKSINGDYLIKEKID
jgi:hypothetical protein